ncbi:serine/threonine-protein kinase [Pseudonocardia sp. TRM90224]|uniref:serine/threonine-protein kinase n=1 Tax=Pseudonocardia sp. TRM90224 TaxID=2812678 RepID=UPI001E60BC96|nr:protein kinase [Pseudonocardia sp. TRM90224]
MADAHFGPYRLEKLIGRGGMGEVHKAYDTIRKRVVALKVLTPQLATDPAFQARFRAESEMAAGLRSAHVIPIHDYGEIDGALFIDMRFVEGRDLGERLDEEGPLSPDEAVHIIGQVAGALDSAHREGLIHRDVKPSNILLSASDGDGRDFAYLVDFGIARMVDGTNGGLTGTGAVIGSVDYMAPERFEQLPSDHRVDVYALACVLAEVLTGSKPFPSGSIATSLYHHMHSPPPRPSQLRQGVPTALDEVVARGMAKDPDQRYATAGALAAAARAALSAPAPANPGETTAAHPPRQPGATRTSGPVFPPPPGQFGPPQPRRAPSGPQYPGSGPQYFGGPAPAQQAQFQQSQPHGRPQSQPHYQQHGQPVGTRVSTDPNANVFAGASAWVPGAALSGAPSQQSEQRPRSGAKVFMVIAAVVVLLGGGLTTLLVVINNASSTTSPQSPTVPTAAKAKPRKVEVAENLPINAATGAVFDPKGTAFFTVGPAPYEQGRTGSQYQLEKHNLDSPAEPGGTVQLPEEAFPQALALTPDGSRALIPTSKSLSTEQKYSFVVANISGAGTVEHIIPMDELPWTVAASKDGKQAYVGTRAGVVVVDIGAGTAAPAIPVGGEVKGLAVTPDGKKLIAVGTAGVRVLSTSTNAVVGSVALKQDPVAVAITPDGASAYVVLSGGNGVAVMDVSTTAVVGAAIPTGERPVAIAITPDGQQAVVSNETTSDVTVIETATGEPSKISVGSSPAEIAFSPDGTVGVVVTSSTIVKLKRDLA